MSQVNQSIQDLDDATTSCGGVNETLKSQLYQVYLLILSFVKLKEDPDFQINTEVKEAEKFDDVLIKYRNSHGNQEIRLLQAKYQLTPEEFTFEKLFNKKYKGRDNKYAFKKYFDSFNKVKNAFANLSDVILCTNNTISIPNSNGIVELSSGTESIFLQLQSTQDEIFGNSRSRFKFSLEQNYKQQSIECMRGQFCLPFDSDTDAKISEFMEKMLFVFDYDYSNINSEIVPILQKDFNMVDVGLYQEIIQSKFIDWVENVQTRKSFNFAKFKELYNDITTALLQHELCGLSRYIYETNNMLKLENINQDLNQFLEDPNSCKFCCLKTQPDETFITTATIYSFLKNARKDTFMMLRTSYEDEKFEKSIDLFCSTESYKTCIIEINDGRSSLLNGYRRELMGSDIGKKILIVSDTDIFSGRSGIFRISQDFIHLTDLTQRSLGHVLNSQVEFQENVLCFKDLVDSNVSQLLSSISFADLSRTKRIVNRSLTSLEFDRDLYVERTLLQKTFLSPEVLYTNFTQDVIATTEGEFDEFCTRNPSKNIHLISNAGHNLNWIKSRGSLASIRKFVKADVSSKLSVSDLLRENCSTKVFILVDIAGMGKSSFLANTAMLLKETFKNEWTIHVNLNSFTRYFHEKPIERREHVEDFLINDVLKLDSVFEIQILHLAMKVGKINIILDGLDEISPTYENKVTEMIRLLMSMNFKRLFISTRPELGELLEDITSHFKITFVPLDTKSQELFLVKYLRKHSGVQDETNLKAYALKIISVVNNQTNNNQFTFLNIGIPIILKMFVEIFTHLINGPLQELEEKAQKITSNLYQLYTEYLTMKIETYLMKEGYHPSQRVSFNMSVNNVKEILKKFAVQKLFSEFQNIFQPPIVITENEKNVIKKTGLMSAVSTNDDLQFEHKTIGEFLSFDYLTENLDNEGIVNLLATKIFQDSKYTVFRSFCASWIKHKQQEKNEDKLKAIYKVILKNLNNTKGDPLQHNSARNLLYITLLHDLNVEAFETILNIILNYYKNSEIRLEQMLMATAGTCFCHRSIIYHYFDEFKINKNILKTVSEKMGRACLKDIFESFYTSSGNTVLVVTTRMHIENSLAILEILQTEFHSDYQVIRDSITRKSTSWVKREFLHSLFETYEVKGAKRGGRHIEDLQIISKILDKLLDIQNHLTKNNQRGIIEELILVQDDDNASILHCLLVNRVEFRYIFMILEWIEQNCGKIVLKKLLLLENKDGTIFSSKFLKKFSFMYWINFYELLIPLLDNIYRNSSNTGSTLQHLQKLAFKNLNSTGEISFNFNQIFFDLQIVRTVDAKTNFASDEMDAVFLGSFIYEKFDQILQPETIFDAIQKILLQKFSTDDVDEDDLRKFNNVWSSFKSGFGRYILGNPDRNGNIFLLASEYSLSDLLFALLDSAVKFVDNDERRTILWELLRSKNSSGHTCFHDIIAQTDKMVPLLGTIKDDHGTDFVKNILLLVDCYSTEGKYRVPLVLRSLSGDSISISNFIIQSFASDYMSLRSILCSRGDYSTTFLSESFKNCFYFKRLREWKSVLESIMNISGELLQEIFLVQDEDGDTFLHNIHLGRLLVALEKILELNFQQSQLEKLLLAKNKDGKNFLFKFKYGESYFSADKHMMSFHFIKILLMIFERSESESKFELLKKLLTEMNSSGESVFELFEKISNETNHSEYLRIKIKSEIYSDDLFRKLKLDQFFNHESNESLLEQFLKSCFGETGFLSIRNMEN